MRNIKFRAWDSAEGVMGIVERICWIEGMVVFLQDRLFNHYLHSCTLLMYTGLKDKNGVEIYEGDILTDFGDAGPLYVEFSEERAGFVFMDKFDNGPPSYTPEEISYEYFEIIGNVFEHPKLLKEEAE